MVISPEGETRLAPTELTKSRHSLPPTRCTPPAALPSRMEGRAPGAPHLQLFPPSWTEELQVGCTCSSSVQDGGKSCRWGAPGALPSILDGRAAGGVHLVGGRLCLDFVNSVGARRVSPSGEMTIRDEKLRDYLDLLAW